MTTAGTAPIRKPDYNGPGRDLQFFPSDPGAATTLSAAQVEHYNSRGYVPELEVYDAGDAADLNHYITDLLETVVSAQDKRNSYSINAYQHVCERLYDIVQEPRILAYVRDILGDEVVCWGTHLFAKLPHDGKEVPFHQDAVFWPMTPSRSVTAWLAIDDADEGNAAMQFVPGSHLEGPIEHETVGLDGRRVLSRRALGMENRSERVIDSLRSGQMSLHSDLLLHGSAANDSDRRRAGLTLRYTRADVRLVEGYEHYAKNSIHCLNGDPSGFWEHNPRPEGEHPEKLATRFGGFDGQDVDAS